MKVYIKELSFKTIIGILPFERVKKQRVLIDISFEYKFNENHQEFIDYSEVANTAKKLMKKKKYKLIEEAIISLERKIKKKFNVSNLSIKISKPNILKDCIVSVAN